MAGKTKLIVLMGAPGSGKGTQAEQLVEQIPGCKHVSTGNLFRAEMAAKTPLGLQVKEIIDSGSLVSDELTDQIFKTQINKILTEEKPAVILLDGYPRKESQARTLVDFANEKSDVMGNPIPVEIHVSEEEVTRRITGRLSNPRTGKIYHEIYNPPKVPMVCDEDGGELIKRPDDNAETVHKRYAIYTEARDAMMNVLKEVHDPLVVNGKKKPSELTPELVKVIESL